MKKLYRSRRDKKLTGLCGGVAEMLNVDATLLRILLIVLTVFTSGAMILVYILAALVVPKEPTLDNGYGPYGYGPGSFNGGWNNNGGYGTPPNPRQGFGGSYPTPPSPHQPLAPNNWQQNQPASNLDTMMEDLEKKALRKEIEELRTKLAKHEKGEF
ncbi:PspC domain-containing protein [Paenibacillus oenotherae]|uniref:PspC domain-containing protein n=1 Tax=Paenibacillus oenotherae TaxID=1435645 RepID=A0ABS7D9G1_9BACL|nr:PspC domain-containing protein [Paenibacillus oenotherae]MBW7476515.1 PspC domain-containing protein [Paenibacillus oenotherae]